jgi:cytochrome c peroxidase
MLGHAHAAQTCPGYTTCPAVLAETAMTEPDAITALHVIESSEATLNRGLKKFGSLSRTAQVARLGLQMLGDLNLSAHKNQSCLSCHTPGDGFTQIIAIINETTVAPFGSQGSPLINGTPTVGDRAGFRRPLNYAYTVFAPKLHLDANKELVGGLFWDMRATGHVTGSPAIDQALGPFVNPVEQALPDPACVVRRISQSLYASEFAERWGSNSFAIAWPPNVDALCARPNSTHDPNPEVLALSSGDRAQATATYVNVATSIAAIEQGPSTSRFTAPYDQILCGTLVPTASEARGMNVFFGKGNCTQCHTSVAPNPPATCGATIAALFTNFRASNIGVPRNPDIPFLTENAADGFGFVANPAGPAFIDRGVGDFLRTLAGNPDPSLAKLAPLAARNDGKFQIPTLRLAAQKPKGAVRSYGHNGEFKSIEQIIHFHNTRDVLGVCPNNSPTQRGFGVTCWPQPEVRANLEQRLVGNLGLTPSEESDLLEFLKTLNVPPGGV